jgi:hypothetical protein
MGESGVNASLSYSTTENGTYTAIASVKDFQPSGFEKTMITVRPLTVANGWDLVVDGFKKGGTVDFELEHDDDECTLLFGYFKNKTKYWFKFELDNDTGTGGTGSNVKFEGAVSKFTPLKTDNEGKVTNSMTITINGEPKFAEMVPGS